MAGILFVLAAFVAAAPETARPPSGPKPARAGAAQPTDDELRRKVDALLGTIDRPVRPEQWRALGPKAAKFIEPVAMNKDSRASRRARAVEALAVVDAKRAQEVLVPLAQSEEQPFLVRMSAVRTLGRLLDPPRRLRTLRPVLESARDVHLRGLAAEVLAKNASACPAVRAQAEKESPSSRTSFRTALRRCGK